MQEKKICPLTFIFEVDLTCEYESCQWWDEKNNCCCIKTIAKSLSEITAKPV